MTTKLRARLSPAECEVADGAAAGRSNGEIAGLRKRSIRTVANQLASVYRKLGVSSRAELAVLLRTLVDPPRCAVVPAELDPLTRRERVIAYAVALGKSNKLIAFELGVSESAVGTHLSAVMRKVGVSSRVQLIGLLGAPMTF